MQLKSEMINLLHTLNMYPQEPLLIDFPVLKEKIDLLLKKYITDIEATKEAKYLVWGIDNNYEAPGYFAWENGRIFSHEDIFPLKEILYCGESFFIPNNSEKYVFKEYGIDYLTVHKGFGKSIHCKEFFSNDNQIELCKKIISEKE